MDCYSLHGCISQLPIQENDRVAGIFCKINSSLDHTNIITYLSDYNLVPMCPIIYGKYNDYGGLCPDESVTVSLLEQFFEMDINHIIDAFIQNTDDTPDAVSIDILKPLINKRNTTTLRNKTIYNISDEDFYNKHNVILKNNWCLLLEHEDIIKTIINNNVSLMSSFSKFSQIPFIPWDELYDIQLKLFQENHLTEWNDSPEDNINFELSYKLIKDYQDILFPSKIYNSFRGVYAYPNVMDLFQNYPEMFHFAFDEKLKHEYLDTLKFYNVLTISHIKMNIIHDSGYQWSNVNLWKDLARVYNEIITPKTHYDY